MRDFLKSILARITQLSGPLVSNIWVGYSLCMLGFLLVIYSFAPGYLSPDSIGNLNQAKTSVFVDINSPLMSYVWGLFLNLAPGPISMFLLQNLMFWSGILIFWRIASIRSAAFGFFVAVSAWMPQILSQLSTVWKDVSLTASLILACSLIYWTRSRKNFFPILLTPPLLFYALGARLNAGTAVLPIAIWSAFVIVPKLLAANSGLLKRTAASITTGLIYFAVLSGAVYFVNYSLTKGETTYPFQQVFLYDLAAVSKATNSSTFPAYITENEGYSLELVKSEYNLRSVNSLIYGGSPKPEDKPILLLTDDPQKIDSLSSRWWAEIKNNPGTYIVHRWNVFAQLIGFTRNTVSNPYWDAGYESNPEEFKRAENLTNTGLTKYFHAFRKYFFFRGYFWMMLGVFFLYKSIRNRLRDDWEMVFYLALSSLLFTAAYFPTTPSTEFRYIFWSVVASSISAIFGSRMLIESRRNSGTH